MNVGALVTLVAAVHYFYMREYWITIGESPIVYRYIDWSITVPLQMIEFYLILSAVTPTLGPPADNYGSVSGVGTYFAPLPRVPYRAALP